MGVQPALNAVYLKVSGKSEVKVVGEWSSKCIWQRGKWNDGWYLSECNCRGLLPSVFPKKILLMK